MAELVPSQTWPQKLVSLLDLSVTVSSSVGGSLAVSAYMFLLLSGMNLNSSHCGSAFHDMRSSWTELGTMAMV